MRALQTAERSEPVKPPRQKNARSGERARGPDQFADQPSYPLKLAHRVPPPSFAPAGNAFLFNVRSICTQKLAGVCQCVRYS